MRGLSYRHPGSGRGVAGVSFEAAAGDFVVITGEVGAGKTTLLRCLAGLLVADAGEILWNGRRLEDPAAFMTPPRAAFTPQTPTLFSETLAANIRMGCPASDADVAAAARLAVLEGDVAGWPAGLETPVGSRGMTLSGGQMRRLAAARSLVREADLMLFDDLSAGLDAATEERLWTRLAAARPWCACIAVSHRQETLRRASQIILLKDGEVAARGTLATLLRSDAAFAKLWDSAG